MSFATRSPEANSAALADDPERAVAARWLEDLQAKVYTALDLRPFSERQASKALLDSDHMNNFVKMYENAEGFDRGKMRAEMAAALAEADKAVPTKYEIPGFYYLMLGMAVEIERALAQHDRHLPVKPLFGTLPTGRVNGFAAAVPDTNCRVILLEDGLFGFANLMCKAVAMALPERSSADAGGISVSTDPEEIRRTLRSNPDIKRRFFDALGAYLVGGHPHYAKPYISSRASMEIGSVLRDAMETFVLAHEYGHVVAGHLGPAVGRLAMVADVGVETISTDWQQEFEADAIGLEAMLAVRMGQGFDLALSFWGADAFFGCVDVVEKAVSVLVHGEERPWLADTHPPTSARRMLLRYLLADSLKAEGRDPAKGPLQLASVIETVIDDLWDSIRPAFVRMHKDGIRPTAGWMAVA